MDQEQQSPVRGRSFPVRLKEGNIEVALQVDGLRPTRNDPAAFKRGQETWAVDWSPDGHYLAWSQGNKIIQLVPWNKFRHCRLSLDDTDLLGNKIVIPTRTFDAGNLVWSLSIGPKNPSRGELHVNEDGHLIPDTTSLVLAAGATLEIKIWSICTGELIYVLTHHKSLVRDLKFALDGSLRLLAGSRDGTLSVWDVGQDGRLLQTLQGNSRWIFGCAWSPNCDLICGVGDVNMVMLWRLSGAADDFHLLEGHQDCVTCCQFSPDSALLATSSFDTTVIIWDPYSHTRLQTLYHCYHGLEPVVANKPDWYVRHLCFSWDSRYLVSACEDGFIRFWDLAAPELLKQVALVSHPLCCTFSPDGVVLAVGNRNGVIKIWFSILQVPSLQHLCRMSIRRFLQSTHLDSLHLPTRLRQYLKYFDDSSPSTSSSSSSSDSCDEKDEEERPTNTPRVRRDSELEDVFAAEGETEELSCDSDILRSDEDRHGAANNIQGYVEDPHRSGIGCESEPTQASSGPADDLCASAESAPPVLVNNSASGGLSVLLRDRNDVGTELADGVAKLEVVVDVHQNSDGSR